MIKSMTGYGKHVVNKDNMSVTVEIRTLNSKQLDLNLRVPQFLKDKEIEIRKLVTATLIRGKIDMLLQVDHSDTDTAPVIDKKIAMHYYSELKGLAESMGQSSFSDYLDIIVKMPDIFIQEEHDVDDSEVRIVFECLENALKAVDTARLGEGSYLEKDFVLRIGTILKLLEEVDNYDNKRVSKIRERILGNIQKFIGDPETDKNRLEQEIIYYIEKLDITEEKVRLKNNCNYFLENLDNEDSSGKKLGFITQEIGREINTLGSKANDSDMQKIVVLMKDELEKIKEQLFNIL